MDMTRVGDLPPLGKGAGSRVLVAFNPELTEWERKGRVHCAKVRADDFEALIGDRNSEIAGISVPVFRKGGELAATLMLTVRSRMIAHVLFKQFWM
ncbi:hypothetical protein [Diaphorobacter sp. HDW4B]|uniref:hypothetical protein n=1 Tax=Diaphorobacter sp. HDW4B TaxID=2714925 RepID=UPI00197AEB63|nr:hypothetical protein [Diaphorobacter sp. HDW4B]